MSAINFNYGMNTTAAKNGNLASIANSAQAGQIRPAELEYTDAAAAIANENQNANFGAKRLPVASFNELSREIVMRFYDAQAAINNQGTVAITA